MWIVFTEYYSLSELQMNTIVTIVNTFHFLLASLGLGPLNRHLQLRHWTQRVISPRRRFLVETEFRQIATFELQKLKFNALTELRELTLPGEQLASTDHIAMVALKKEVDLLYYLLAQLAFGSLCVPFV